MNKSKTMFPKLFLHLTFFGFISFLVGFVLVLPDYFNTETLGIRFLMGFVTLLGILVLWVVVMGNETLKINLAVSIWAIGIASIFGVFILNLGMGKVASLKEEAFQRTAGIIPDERPVYEVVRDMRAERINAYPFIYPTAILKELASEGRSPIQFNGMNIVPFGGVANATIVFCNESGEYLIYESDEFGFHNPSGIWDFGKLDIALVGDSFVHGSCVPSDKNMAGLLRETHPKTLNLGSAGNGPLLMLGSIKEYLVYKQPDLVLWFFYEGNDLNDLQIEKNTMLVTYLQEGTLQNLLSQAEKIRPLVEEYGNHLFLQYSSSDGSLNSQSSEWKNLLTLTTIRDFLGYRKSKIHNERNADYDFFEDVLRKANETVNQWGGQLCFIYLPEQSRYTGLSTNGIMDIMRTKVFEKVRESGIPSIDIHQVFVDTGNPNQYFPSIAGAHYNPEGYQLITETILSSECLGE